MLNLGQETWYIPMKDGIDKSNQQTGSSNDKTSPHRRLVVSSSLCLSNSLRFIWVLFIPFLEKTCKDDIIVPFITSRVQNSAARFSQLFLQSKNLKSYKSNLSNIITLCHHIAFANHSRFSRLPQKLDSFFPVFSPPQQYYPAHRLRLHLEPTHALVDGEVLTV